MGRRSGNGVINVDVVVSEEIWIKRDPEQTTLARRIDGETQERCGQQGAVLDYPQLAGLEADKEPVHQAKMPLPLVDLRDCRQTVFL